MNELRSYRLRTFFDGVSFGVGSAAFVCGVADYLHNYEFNYPYGVGLTIAACATYSYVARKIYGGDLGFSLLEDKIRDIEDS